MSTLITYLSACLICLINGHRWQVVNEDFTFCKNCDKALKGRKAAEYFQKWKDE